jgi:hypothetical protein
MLCALYQRDVVTPGFKELIDLRSVRGRRTIDVYVPLHLFRPLVDFAMLRLREGDMPPHETASGRSAADWLRAAMLADSPFEITRFMLSIRADFRMRSRWGQFVGRSRSP